MMGDTLCPECIQHWTPRIIRGQVGTSASRVHQGMESLGAMGLQGARASRVHPAWTPWIQTSGGQVQMPLEGPKGQVGMPALGVHPLDRLQR